MSNVGNFFDALPQSCVDAYLSDPAFLRRYKVITALLDDELGQRPSGRAIDFGCGTGVFSAYMASRGWKVISVDMSRPMLDAAAQYCRQALGPRSSLVEFRQGEVESFCAPGLFDFALCLSVLEYVSDYRAALISIAKTLKPGGYLLISVPNQTSVVRVLERFVWWLTKRLRRRRSAYLEYQRHQFTPERIDQETRALGFVKRKQIFWATGITRPEFVVALLERRPWAGMYCALYWKPGA